MKPRLHAKGFTWRSGDEHERRITNRKGHVSIMLCSGVSDGQRQSMARRSMAGWRNKHGEAWQDKQSVTAYEFNDGLCHQPLHFRRHSRPSSSPCTSAPTTFTMKPGRCGSWRPPNTPRRTRQGSARHSLCSCWGNCPAHYTPWSSRPSCRIHQYPIRCSDCGSGY